MRFGGLQETACGFYRSTPGPEEDGNVALFNMTNKLRLQARMAAGERTSAGGGNRGTRCDADLGAGRREEPAGPNIITAE